MNRIVDAGLRNKCNIDDNKGGYFMKKVLVVISVLFFVAAIGLVKAPSASAQINLKYTNWFPPVHAMNVLAQEWCKEIEKRTNGKVKITYFPGGTLVPAVQTYDGVVNGIADIGLHTQQYSTGRFPLTELMYLPIQVKSSRQASKMLTEWFDKFKPKEYDDTKVLYHFTTGPINFQTTKPISSINDIKGLKIRGGGDSAKIINALGGTPVSIPMADSYDGFQRGVMQGTLQAAEVLKGWRFGDLIKTYMANDGIGAPQTFVVVINKEKWSSLPPDVQKIFEEVSREWSPKTAAAMDQADKEGMEYGISKGMKVVTVSKAERDKTIQLMKPILDDYVAKMKKLGLPGDQHLKWVQDWVKKNPNP